MTLYTGTKRFSNIKEENSDNMSYVYDMSYITNIYMQKKYNIEMGTKHR